MVIRLRSLAAPVIAAAAGIAGCGSGRAHRLPAAEPGHGAVPAQPPAGRSTRVGGQPQGIAVDSDAGLVAVGVRNPSAIVLLSARTGRVLRRIPIAGAPRHLQLAAPGGPLLVPEESVDRLLELSLPSGAMRSFRVGAFPHDAVADGGRVFVSDERGHSVSVIEPTGGVTRVGGFTQPGGVVGLGAKVAVVDVGAFTVTLLDAATLRRIATAPAGAGPTHAVAGPAGRLYVVDTRGDRLLTYDTRPYLRRLGTTRLPGSPYGIAADLRRGRLWVTETARNRLAELTLAGPLPRVTRLYPTGRQPDTVAVDTRDGQVFVADQLAGTVERISPVAR